MNQKIQDKCREQIIEKVSNMECGDFLFMENLLIITDIYHRFVTDDQSITKDEINKIGIINDTLNFLSEKQVDCVHHLTNGMSMNIRKPGKNTEMKQ